LFFVFVYFNNLRLRLFVYFYNLRLCFFVFVYFNKLVAASLIRLRLCFFVFVYFNNMDDVIDLTSHSETSPCSSPRQSTTIHSATSKKRKLDSDTGKTFYIINVDDPASDSAFAKNVPDRFLTLFRAVHSKSSADSLGTADSLTVGELVDALGFNVADYLKQQADPNLREGWDEDEKEIMETFLTKLDNDWNFHQPYGKKLDVRAELRYMETGTADGDDFLKADLHSEFVFYRVNVDE